MPILVPTREHGATARAVGWDIPDPAAAVSAADLALPVPDGVDGVFLADLLSAVATHERCGAHLYRSVAARTVSDVLRERYEAFGRETLHHVDVMEELVTSLGGNPTYMSPAARKTEATDAKLLESTFLLAGSIDPFAGELALVEAVFVAESVDHANWASMADLRDALPDGDVRDAVRRAVDEVEPDEDEHLEWARSTRARLVAQRLADTDGAAAEFDPTALDAAITRWLSG
jgi:hypothetical protein